jgi:hypothetical protein
MGVRSLPEPDFGIRVSPPCGEFHEYVLDSLIGGAGDGIRTHEYQLGRLMPYHLATPA